MKPPTKSTIGSAREMSRTRADKPRLGTPEFDEFLDQQGQNAMDAAVANPFIRLFAVVAFVVFAAGAVVYVEIILEELPWNMFLFLHEASVAVLLSYLATESASVVLRGRTFLPVYRILVVKLRAGFAARQRRAVWRERESRK